MKTFICFFIILGVAVGQCVGPYCPIPYSRTPPNYSKKAPNYSQRPPNYSKSPPAACRIQSGTYIGTGILVAKTNRAALVLTCAHLFNKHETILVTFGDGKKYKARLERIDRTWDLAALVIASPAADPVTFATIVPKRGDRVFGGGFGGNGRWAWVSGAITGFAKPERAKTFEYVAWQGSARDGDSGGPLVNRAGQLVGLVVGTGTETSFSVGPVLARIRHFLRGLLDRFRVRRRPAAPPITEPPPVEAPPAKVSPPSPVEAPPAKISPPSPVPKKSKPPIKTQRKPLEENLRDIWPGRIANLPTPVKAGFWALIGKAFGISAVTAAGAATGGTGAMAASMLFWYLGRRRRKRERRPVANSAVPFSPPPINPPDLHPRDVSEARSFLQLSELEGRDPVVDGLVGRLTLDALDELIEGNNKQKSMFASEFKTKLQSQVNEMVPLSI